MIQGKLEEWFDYHSTLPSHSPDLHRSSNSRQEYKIYQWLQRNALDRLNLDTSSSILKSSTAILEDGWKERKQAENSINAYLTDTPTTVAFIHGPQGSGKSRMVKAKINELKRSTLVIDCRELLKATSDSQIVGELAKQTGYWPIFNFLNSMSSLVDLASVGLIGQKSKPTLISPS
jgi:predicted AAA+ superfamily ATPase